MKFQACGKRTDLANTGHITSTMAFVAALLPGCWSATSDGNLGTYVPSTQSEGGSGAGAIPGLGGSASGGSGGSTDADANGAHDPNIVFDWPEADPTLVCLPGT